MEKKENINIEQMLGWIKKKNFWNNSLVLRLQVINKDSREN